MPTNRSLTGPRARLAGLSNWHPGSPEQRAAAQEFYYLLLSQKVEEVLAKAPPFTPEQRETIVALLRTAEVAPESTDAP